MKILSIDIETTGLDPAVDQILSFAAIAFSTDDGAEYSFSAVINPFGKITGDPYALWLNAGLLLEISKGGEHLVPASMLLPKLASWLKNDVPWFGNCPKLIVAGKNVSGFDMAFLKQLPDAAYHLKAMKIGHRCLDIGPMFATPDMAQPPTLQECLEIAGMKGVVTHTALEDARDVVECLKWKWRGGKNEVQKS